MEVTGRRLPTIDSQPQSNSMNPSHLASRPTLWLLSSVSSTLLTFAGWLILTGNAKAQEPEQEVRFSQDIQPLLARRCFACHGPDQAEGGLRLNSRQQAIAKLESGHTAIAPGAPDQSELLKRIRSTDEADRMPPEGKPLTEREQKLIERWIAQVPSGNSTGLLSRLSNRRYRKQPSRLETLSMHSSIRNLKNGGFIEHRKHNRSISFADCTTT